MLVRMIETRVMMHGLKDAEVLYSGKEYEVPAAFGAYLVMDGRAEYRVGRLAKRVFQGYALAGEKRRRSTMKKAFITLDD